MLELGENVEQAANLLDIHTDLMQRLKSKEEQVEELLARADNLVTQQKEPDVIVYEAMAESLGSTWKELNTQLQMRGFLLTEALRFYKLAQEHERLALHIRSLLRPIMSGSTAGDLRNIAEQAEQEMNDLINVTAKAVDSGADIISQIRVLGAMADNIERSQEIVDACLKVEKIMLSLAAEWESLEEIWKEERLKLETLLDTSAAFIAQLEEIESWLQDARAQFKCGGDMNSILQQALHQRTILQDVMRSIKNDAANAHLSGRAARLHNDVENLTREIESKRRDLDRVRAFINTANSMLNQLSSMETDMRNANAAMAGELAPLARQKAQTVIDEGRSLSHLDIAVSRLVTDIETKLRQIEALARDRINSAAETLRNELYRLESWLTDVAEPFVSSHNRLGSNLAEANEFYSSYKEFITDVVNKETEVVALLNRSREFSDADKKRLQEFANRFERFKKIVEGRRQFGGAFQQVHKFARELEGSFESLNALLCSNRNFSNERLTNQMTQVFHMIQETLSQERHQGEKFIATAKSVGEVDADLKVGEAIDSVRRVLEEHEEKFSTVTESWQRWQQVRTQEQKVVHIIEEVQMWQEDTLEIIRVMEEKVERVKKSKLVQEREELKRKMDEVIRSLPRQNDKILEAESITRASESEEAYERMKSAKRRQRDIEERITQLRKRIEVMEELTVEEKREVTRAPEIVTRLLDSMVEEGSRFEFAARVEAEPPPKISWFKDGRDVKDNVDYHTEYVNGVASLTIEETFVEDTAVYTLRAENKAGVAESSAQLIVKSRSEMGSQAEENYKPRFIRQLRNLTVNEGETARMDCVVVGHPEPKVIWYKEEETIKESERINLQFEGDHCSLTIKDTLTSDSGLYTAKAANSAGESTNFCRLTVHAPVRAPPPPTPPKPKPMMVPAFVPTLSNQVVQEGQRTILQVRAMGEPTPKVYWKFNEQPIRTTTEMQLVEEASGWSRLIIENARPEHSGMYTVIAENAAGEARSGATLLVEPKPVPPSTVSETIVETTVNEGYWDSTMQAPSPTPPPVPKHRYRTEVEEYRESQLNEYGYSPTATAPEFIRPFQNEYTVTEGDKFKMECLMVGNPRPKVHLYFNDQLINSSSKFCSFSNVGDSYSIILEPAKRDHAGFYKMTAENVRGRTESLTVLHVRPRSFTEQQATAKPFTTEHVHMVEEFGAYEYEQQMPPPRTIQKQHIEEELGLYSEERRVAAKHSARLTTPPPAKKQQLVTTHEQRQKLLEEYEIEESRRAGGHPPHFTQTLVSVVTACGDSASFEGVVTGWPAPEVQWTKDGVPITKVTNPELQFSNIGGRVSLTFPVAELEHAGKYMCTAKNASGVATSSAQLVVRPKTVAPDFVKRLISEEVVEGDQLKWTVQVTGDPVPKVTWLRDGQEIPNCEEVQLLDEGGGFHSMLIVKVEIADCGQFTCLAENVAGEARSTADLVVRPYGTEPGNYFHVTKVTQEKQVKGEEVTRNQALSIENPRGTPGT